MGLSETEGEWGRKLCLPGFLLVFVMLYCSTKARVSWKRKSSRICMGKRVDTVAINVCDTAKLQVTPAGPSENAFLVSLLLGLL